MGKLRAFIAVEISDELKEKVRDIQLEFRGFGLRFVNPAIAHLTLKFLGDVPEGKIKEIGKAMETVECEPFEAELKGVGVFPNLNRIRVIWVGAHGNFNGLHDSVESKLTPLGFARDGKEFKSHITVARAKDISKNETREIADKVRDLSKMDIGSMMVERIKLKKSTLTSNGPIYEDLHVKELGG
ncbi:MAG: RNA 2',3'-cyclic phosphodiesterase [Halobacteriota archaeon]|nr:RNA 2',3'-cyclic phosphodiesterase [Halobacteriota archaeon]